MRAFALFLALIFATVPAAAGCINVSPGNQLKLEGLLGRTVFPGPPNYENIESGDAPEAAFILELDTAICIDDGGELADPKLAFKSVQLFTTVSELWPKLDALTGKRIIVTGTGFAAHTGHHHAPLVVDATSLAVP